VTREEAVQWFQKQYEGFVHHGKRAKRVGTKKFWSKKKK
jgi:hypothetical protein